MAIIDVLKCDRPELMVWKWQPPGGGQHEEELRLGTQLIVNQIARMQKGLLKPPVKNEADNKEKV